MAQSEHDLQFSDFSPTNAKELPTELYYIVSVGSQWNNFLDSFECDDKDRVNKIAKEWIKLEYKNDEVDDICIWTCDRNSEGYIDVEIVNTKQYYFEISQLAFKIMEIETFPLEITLDEQVKLNELKQQLKDRL